MIDTMTRKPLQILGHNTDWPYIMVPFSQLLDLRHILDQHNVRYSVDANAISLDGEPETTFVNLGRGVDVAAIQAILNSTG